MSSATKSSSLFLHLRSTIQFTDRILLLFHFICIWIRCALWKQNPKMRSRQIEHCDRPQQRRPQKKTPLVSYQSSNEMAAWADRAHDVSSISTTKHWAKSSFFKFPNSSSSNNNNKTNTLVNYTVLLFKILYVANGWVIIISMTIKPFQSDLKCIWNVSRKIIGRDQIFLDFTHKETESKCRRRKMASLNFFFCHFANHINDIKQLPICY